ncbi:2OG-Fe(II) oxygenase [Arenicella xantha]|uniref:Rps23 Pro-64 3,4-dihydroxylase Tpa1-like proline 4-hydroxylase n=1 Tax=Arenicella xantha TaxID=644221 RepID=A0A395JS59_9GAMM|nr:2OG-Fe(II) oxygenase family protein [Arenicella xantha]RBP53286.1 Rps23 Pro-64 3,4-dihydroxylase Tpa1-like proline 4-hydroxylase [Arenicella xantha]
MQIQLNPNLGTTQLASDFQQKKRLRIDNILSADSAEAILDCLKNQTAWQLLYSNADSSPTRLNNQQLEQTTIEQIKATHAQVYARATSSYQYWYKFFPMVEAITTGQVTEKSPLNEVTKFLNSAEFIGLARKITGHSSLVKIDPHATLYEPGDFKNLHDDMRDDKDARDKSIRRYAVVIDFTKNWSVNWGGEMQFYPGQNPTTSESIFPGFNALTLFQVPTLHRTNMVAPYAAKGRYAIAGWLRDDPNITRLDLGDTPVEAK